MSVLQIPTHVMKMQFALTRTVLRPVLVNKDSLEMEQFVKVNTVDFYLESNNTTLARLFESRLTLIQE